MGRFTAVDPITITKKRLANPQALNLYNYVLNNPLLYKDPDGRDVALTNDTEAGRKKALYIATKNQTVAEQRNIAYRKDANGNAPRLERGRGMGSPVPHCRPTGSKQKKSGFPDAKRPE